MLRRSTVALVWICLLASTAHGETPRHGPFEIAMLGGATFLMGDYNDSAVFAVPATASVLPFASMLHLSYWVGPHATVNAGLSWLSLNEAGKSSNHLVIEGGPGVVLGKTHSPISPFVNVLAGFVHRPQEKHYIWDEWDRWVRGREDTFETFLGAQVGARSWIRNYAAVRVQAGYRRLFGKDEDHDIFELLGGLSVFF